VRRLFHTNAPPPGPSLASLLPLVDILTLLLVAILRTWNTQPPMPQIESGFALPVSRAEAEPSLGLTIDVGTDGIYVDGFRTGSATHWTRAKEILIPELLDTLHAAGAQRVQVRAHREAPWKLVGKVLTTAQEAGVSDVELVAISRASL